MSLEENHGSMLEAGTAEDSQHEPTVSSPNAPDSTETSANSAEPSESVSSPDESSEMGDLLESVDSLSPVAQGEVVAATVVKLTDAEVVVDVGLKCEGAIPRSEFLGLDGQVTVAPGDQVHVLIERYNEREGTVAASYQKVAQREAWEAIERAHQNQTTLRGKVLERIKGGATVDLGIPAFLPGSHADTRPHFNIDSLLGQEIPVKVIKANRKRNNAVVSRRLAIQEELAERKARLLEQFSEGAVLTGRVKNLTDYGAFIDLGGIDGLLHITDLSWGRVGKPSDVVQPDEEVRVKILRYDPEKGRVSLGLKQLTPDPWEAITEKYHVGDHAAGRVVGIVNYGVFVELEPGVEGLIHVSELSWSKRLKHPSKIVNLGDQVDVRVLDVNPTQRRISLSLRQTLPDPWTTLAQRLVVGSVVEGRVRNLTEFGAFVELEEGIDGLVHLSNMSWAKDVLHPSEVVKKGQKIEVVILGMDPTKRRISLGLRQTGPDAWTEFCSRVETGEVVRGQVSRLAAFGAFVEIEDGVEGLCHTSEINSGQSGKKAGSLDVGKEYNFRILRLNPTDKKVALSMKEVEQQATASDAAEETPRQEEAEAVGETLAAGAPAPSEAEPTENASAAGQGS